MKQSNDFAHDMIDCDQRDNLILYCCSGITDISEEGGALRLSLVFRPYRHDGIFQPAEDEPDIETAFTLRAFGPEVLRFSGSFTGEEIDEESVMLQFASGMEARPLHAVQTDKGWEVFDEQGALRMRVPAGRGETRRWSDLQPDAFPMFQGELFPDGRGGVPFFGYDQFFPGKFESIPLGFRMDGKSVHALFSLHSLPEEHFAGTGERFSRMDLAGKTVTLENTDALGTNNRKAYKNIPFYLSSRGYGLFIHSSHHMRISFADISTRAVQGLVEEGRLDMFFIGGGEPERILYNYRRLTGFSPSLPVWSYGVWMSRMSYFSAEEIEEIGTRLRREDYPCDVFHLDSGYFPEDWVCTWDFSEERFPRAEEFLRRMRKKGFRFSAWQTPNIGKENPLYRKAVEKRYLPPVKENGGGDPMSDFSGQDFGGQIDFTNQEAVEWYKNLLRGLLRKGIDCIKTDFGEKILMNSDFKKMSPQALHNLYALLYQKYAFEVSGEFSDQPIIWARSSWAGAQRYPLHWGGDTAATWDGMAATLRGGLHFGLSGFTYWSHDVSGFHGLPEFMNTWPEEGLYLRWTQFGTFTSHFRYHGTSPREPWEYPGVADLVRKWWKLRYALIPYLLSEGKHCGKSGLPMIAPLLLHHRKDPVSWYIDSQYYLGRDFLVSPVMNGESVRDVYLPEGEWVDFWTGEVLTGGVWLGERRWPLAVMPVFVRKGAEIPFYPDPVSHTGEIDPGRTRTIRFDDEYRGLPGTFLGEVTGFREEELKD